MTTVIITLDPASPVYRELERELRGYLQSLETVKYKAETRPAEAGQLSGIETETVTLVINLSTAVVALIAAILTLVAQVNASSGGSGYQQQQTKTQFKLGQIMVESEKTTETFKTSLLVSDATARDFLRKVAVSIGEAPPTGIQTRKPNTTRRLATTKKTTKSRRSRKPKSSGKSNKVKHRK